MAGVGKQGQRTRAPAVKGLDGDEADVEPYARAERTVERFGCPVIVGIVCHPRIYPASGRPDRGIQ